MGAGLPDRFASGVISRVACGDSMGSVEGVGEGEGEVVRRESKFWPLRKTAKPTKPITRTVTRPTTNDFMAYIIR